MQMIHGSFTCLFFWQKMSNFPAITDRSGIERRFWMQIRVIGFSMPISTFFWTAAGTAAFVRL
jgi:hypothetical protein